MPRKVTLYAIYAVADMIDDRPFDTSVLPFRIMDGVFVEDVSGLFKQETFEWVGNELGRRDVQLLQGVKYAIVHRYDSDEAHGGDDDARSERLIRNVVACLRLIRPMRQRVSLMRGEFRDDGTLNVRYFEHPREIMEVPEVQKLFHLRNSDLDLLRSVIDAFVHAMENQFWKFRMAIDFHEAGHFQDWYWKARYSLWCSALESLFTTQSPEHQGSLVARERIKWFLGENTSIYDPGDIPSFIFSRPTIAIRDIIGDVYTIRNLIAHGDRVPDEFFNRKLRHGIDGDLCVVQVLLEAVSFIVRKSLLRILEDNLLCHFADAASSEAYFGGAGLTNAALRQQQKQQTGP